MKLDLIQIVHQLINAETQNILITSHAFPDGDSIASQVALAYLLKQLNKNVMIYNQDTVPERYRYLPGSQWIQTDWNPEFNPQLLLVLDVLPWERLGTVQWIRDLHLPLIVLDHHIHDHPIEEDHYIDPGMAATAQIIYQLYLISQLPICREAADCLYTGILTDTGRFRFSNTSADILQMAADLVRHGANPETITREIYFNRNPSFLKNLGKVLNTIEIVPEYQCLFCHFTMDMNNGMPIRMEETEDIIEYVNCLESVKLYIFIKEYKSGEFKVSLRSRDEVDARNLAVYFGGGGHKHASGAKLSGNLIQVRAQLMEQLHRVGTNPPL
ncbi:MAG: bifunctional oligoribonuclease/PAP phosphatase NrnA [Candidatus Delongbacteria bacterium]|nr:bifunctional oligoribonuclease/PAP phosphatase NrnA [Candidatus Delongbacteria bacterium]